MSKFAHPVLKGGSYLYSTGDWRTFFRRWSEPGSQYLDVGFRIVVVRGKQ